jgi:hypothetical protein
MEIILNKRWNYQFIKDNGKYILSVMCGTVGLFEVDVELNKHQIANYKRNGIDFIEKCVKEIRANPNQYIKT